MIGIKYYVACLLLMVLTIGCKRSTLGEDAIKQEMSIHLRASDRASVDTRAGVSDAAIDDQSIYILVFDGDENGSLLLDFSKATPKGDGSYRAPLKKQSEACYAYILANAASEVEALIPDWNHLTTLQQVRESLKTESLPQVGDIIEQMPSKHPMCAMQALARGIGESTLIGTPTSPIELTRATAKLVVAYAGQGTHFSLSGASIGSAPVKSFILPDVQGTGGAEKISTAHYGLGGDIFKMMADLNPTNDKETTPLYAYESIKENETFIIIQGKFNGVSGYYRIDMRMPDNKSEYLPLLRNYYYRITITRVYKAGDPSVINAINNPAENGIQATIEIVDADSHEIISNGVDYMGLSNSEYRLYDSYALNEFHTHIDGGQPYNSRNNYELINGYTATTINYKSHTVGTVTCVECTTVSEGTKTSGIKFRDTKTDIWGPFEYPDDLSWGNVKEMLDLPASTEAVIRKEIIIVIPHDLISGKIKIKLGTLEKEILIEKHNVASYMGEVYDMGTGFSMAKIELERTYAPTQYNGNPPSFTPKPTLSSTATENNADFVRFSTSETSSYTKTLTPQASDRLYVKIDPVSTDPYTVYRLSPYFPSCVSNFYLTRASTQSRIKIHLTREAYMDSTGDGAPLGPNSGQYVSAFWKNNQTGERIIRIPLNNGYNWSARVVYGQDFIRLANVDTRTNEEILAEKDAEKYQADNTWATYIQQPFYADDNTPQLAFRIALTSKQNPTDKPRYGVVVLIAPYAFTGVGSGQIIMVMVRQGEEAEYIFQPTDTYQGVQRIYAQAFSPYSVTVSDTTANLGGPNYADHKSMNGPGVFSSFPSQSGYLYQYGNDVAIHPANPEVKTPISNYKYDYTATYKEVCPAGYTIPLTDNMKSGTNHSLLYDLQSGETPLRNPLGLCADGFYDRQLPNYNNVAKGSAHVASPGIVYYNPATMASVFIPRSNYRQSGIGIDNGAIVFWGHTLTPSDNKKQQIFQTGGYVSRLFIYDQDRKGAFPVRCVKIRDFDQSAGVVNPPSNGGYENWQ